MKENPKAFAHGTRIVDSPFGEGGGKAYITLTKPEGMGNEDFEEYLEICNKACEGCEFRKILDCTTFERDGRTLGEEVEAIAEGLLGHAQTLMKTHEVPCIQNRKQ